jgi:hypothetical protein
MPLPTLCMLVHAEHLTSCRLGKSTDSSCAMQCGILNDRLGGDLDMVSYGPTIHGAHSPDEAVLISTVPQFWSLTKKLMQGLARHK